MSGYGRSHPKDDRSQGGRRRSVSPRRDRRGEDPYGHRDESRNTRSSTGRQDYGGSGRDSGFGRRGGRGDYRGDRGSQGSGSTQSSGSFRSSLPNLPKAVDVPKGGRLFELKEPEMKGTAGSSTRINVNHYEIQSLPVQKTYQYNIRMRVPGSSQRRGGEKVSSMQKAKVVLHDTVRSLWGSLFVFDGVSLGWSPKEFVPVGKECTTTIDLPGHTSEKPNQIQIAIRNNGPLDIGALVTYMKEGRIDLNPMGDATIEPLLKWLNAVFRKDPASREGWVTRPNANAYFERSRDTMMELRSTGGVLEALRGVFQTIQLRFGKVTLNVDTATTAFWTPDKNLIQLVHALAGIPPRENIERWFLEIPDRFFHMCQRLIGIFINVQHLNPWQNAKKMKFQKFSLKDSRETKFDELDHTTGATIRTTVYDYFKRKYNVTLRYPELPLAVTKDGEFPLELCYSSAGERFKEPLQGTETADFIKFATAPAFVRAQQITENVKKLHWHELEGPTAFGLSVKPHMLQIAGRVLPSPIPQYGGGTSDSRAPEGGRWNLRNKVLLQPGRITSWGLLYFPGRGPIDDGTLQRWASAVMQSFRALGLSVPRGLPSFLKGNPQGTMSQMIAELMTKAKQTFGQKPDLLMFLIHGSSEMLYKTIKNICDVLFGVASQVMLVEKAVLGRGQPQYLANICLKVNVKLGGINSTIQEPMLCRQRWMMMGGDTSHPTPSQLRLNPPPPSFSALSASWDRNCTAYTSIASAQFAKEQLISDFTEMARELIKRYKTKNKEAVPEAILYYRDGLSEGEFVQILANEAEPLRYLLEEFDGPKPKVTVVVCVKRHHTRLFPTEHGDKLGNVLPGTVVENSVSNDIFLVAHLGLQGTVRPTRYAVLLDENNLSADEFQRLTNNICWAYARATTAVSVGKQSSSAITANVSIRFNADLLELVPPVYYADQACERAKLHMREGPDGTNFLGNVHENLKFSMYWQ
ncbi:MAG: hypothetical protein M1827_003944 [Pycnora praestabilis]|nr:MAG: hypothetical protein M1827_003944 [Pycnora praestabilis]